MKFDKGIFASFFIFFVYLLYEKKSELSFEPAECFDKNPYNVIPSEEDSYNDFEYFWGSFSEKSKFNSELSKKFFFVGKIEKFIRN